MILAAIIAVAVAGATLVKIGPHGIHEQRTIYHVGLGEVLVDTNPSELTNVTASSAQLGGRAELISQYATDPQIVDKIAQLTGVPSSQLQVQAQTTSPTKAGGSNAKGVVAGAGPNSVLLQSTGQGQTIQITAQAHNGKAAKALVSATILALTRSLKHLQSSQPLNHVTAPTTTSTTTTTTSTTSGKAAKKNPASSAAAALAAQAAKAKAARAVAVSKIVLRPLGAVTSRKVVSTPKKTKTIGYAVVAFIVLLIIILVLDNLLEGVRRSRTAAVATASSSDKS